MIGWGEASQKTREIEPSTLLNKNIMMSQMIMMMKLSMLL